VEKTTDQILFDLMIDLNERRFSATSGVKKKLLVLSTERSGSSLFCEVLGGLNVVGECREWLNPRYLQAYAKMLGEPQVNVNQYVNFVISKTVNEAGVFALNLHIKDYQFWLERSFDVLSIGFDLIIYLHRRDKLAQAISLAKAEKFDSWSSSTKSNDEKLIDNLDVVRALHHLIAQENNYVANLRHLVKFEYCYEEFSELARATPFFEVAEYLGVDIEESTLPKPSLEKQANVASDEIRSSFMSYILGD